MKSTTLILFSLATTTLSLAGCGAPDPATGSVLQAQRCPPAGCDGPPDPGDPNPKPPKDPPPPQPDPAKWRTAYIPISYVASMMNDVLGNTLAQISQTTGPALAIPSKVCQRTTQSAADEQECKDACNSDPQLTLAQKTQCRANCASTTTCTNVCGSYYTTSYLRWGPAAAAASVTNSTTYCDQTTCPACATRTQVASLKNIDLSAKIPRLHADIPVTGASIDCSINQWQFAAQGNIAVESTNDTIYVTIPGKTGNPAIHCTNAPDPTVDDLALQVKFQFPWGPGSVLTHATLLGDWHVIPGIDLLADIDGRIGSAIDDATFPTLNSVDAQQALLGVFGGLTEQYVTKVLGQQFDRFGDVEPQYGQLKVGYWIK
jgi:hypothetical protein